ncbi:MAG TPA: methyltransferase domain-containing protein [Methanospirillum sp.]|nr:methyltransferase domain-containing protein [Methanospirillum sp.]
MESFASGFARVDTTNNAHSFVHYLDLIHSLPFFQKCKNQSYENLNLSLGDSVLEIGCGNGVDAKNLAERVGESGKAIGIDISSTMVRAARESTHTTTYPPEFILCDGQHLAFPDASFQAVRSDRVIQHTRDPFAVIKEIARVTKPAGKIVVFEPDWETFTLWPANREISRKVLTFWCDSIPSGWVGRSLYGAFSAAGLVGIKVQPITLTITDLAVARKIFDLETTFSEAVKKGLVESIEATNWEDNLVQADLQGQFFSSLTFFMVMGNKQS